ncbi:MAG: hypothetical protein KDD99_15865, partial [Bacteroidetes bacterium]|nr:hypothetical protein [Bacteroidota bacterium]
MSFSKKWCWFYIIIIFHFPFFLHGQEKLMLDVFQDTLKAREDLKQASLLISQGQYNGALEQIESAKALYQKHQLWENVIDCEVQLSSLSDNFPQKGFDLKIKYAQSALRLSQLYLPQDTLLYALSLRQKAESLTWIGLFDSSLYFLNLAVPIFEKNQKWDEWAYCRIDQAVNYQFKEELDSANLYLQNVHNKIYKIFLPEEDKLDILATLLDLLGTQYSRLEGDYDKAIDSTLKALKIDLGKTHIRN